MRAWTVPLLLLLAACSTEAPAASPAEQAGCDGAREVKTEELYVQEAYECNSGPARVLVFADNEARDSFVEIAEGFGGQYEVGDAWAAELR